MLASSEIIEDIRTSGTTKKKKFRRQGGEHCSLRCWFSLVISLDLPWAQPSLDTMPRQPRRYRLRSGFQRSPTSIRMCSLHLPCPNTNVTTRSQSPSSSSTFERQVLASAPSTNFQDVTPIAAASNWNPLTLPWLAWKPARSRTRTSAWLAPALRVICRSKPLDTSLTRGPNSPAW